VIDECGQIALSLADSLARTVLSCRCFWHLSQNIHKKLKKAIGADAFQELTRCFQAALYATTETEMRAKWSAVMQCAEASDALRGVHRDNTAVSAVSYMEHILLDERRWACWYRTGRLTLGIASTQRCEGFFGKLKQQLGLISSLQHLGATVHSLSGCDEYESRLLTESLALRTSTQLLPGFDTVRLVVWLLCFNTSSCLTVALSFDLPGLGCHAQEHQELWHALPAPTCGSRNGSCCTVRGA
jgi:hypothetical protein